MTNHTDPYNYRAFSSKDYDFDRKTGPELGEKAPDFLVVTSAGKSKYLLDFDCDFLVLETGSLTCPLFQSRRNTMQTLGDIDKRVRNVVLYVREAHPGQDIPQHANFESKRRCAERLKTEDGESRFVMVDDFEGTVHRAYGGMPNAVFIINRKGCVVFRAQWNNPKTTRKALNALLSGRTFSAKSFFKPATPAVSIRTLRRAGNGAGLDFLRSFPALVWNNLIKRNLRLLFNRREPLSGETTC